MYTWRCICAVSEEVQLDPKKPKAPQLKTLCEGKIHISTARFNKVAPEEVAEVFARQHTPDIYLKSKK